MIRADRNFVETPISITKPQTITPTIDKSAENKEVSKNEPVDKKEVASFLSSTDSACIIKFENKEPKDLKQAVDIIKEFSRLGLSPSSIEKGEELKKQFGEAIKNLSPDDINKLKSELSKMDKSNFNSIISSGLNDLTTKVDDKIKLNSMSSSDIVKEFSKLGISPSGLNRAKELKEEFAIRVQKMPHSEMLELKSELQKDLNSMYEKKTVTLPNGQSAEVDRSTGMFNPQELIDIISKKSMSELDSLKGKILEK